MKPYILNYSETVTIQKSELKFNAESQTSLPLAVDRTTLTFTVESGDDDSISLSNTTRLTETVEGSDEDDICSVQPYSFKSDKLGAEDLGATYKTESIEPSDDDEFYVTSSSTVITKTLESSDEDDLSH